MDYKEIGRRKRLGSKYLCLDCGEVYDSSRLHINELFEYVYCPKTNCDGTLIEVDELMIPIIQILNDKGYITKYCCSGHYDGHHPNAYIMFEDWVELPSIPKGFKKDDDCSGHVVIRSTLPPRTPLLDDFKSICNNAKILLDWAVALPYCEDFE